MSLPTISLAVIAKNEEKNIRRLLDSVKDCFHEIVFVDTGSTDKTKEIAQEYGCKLYDFTWVDSFCKARNFSFSKCTSDYIMWLDLDDALLNREAFIQWRDNAMALTPVWFATYNYALDANGKPIISFVRERVFRRSLNPVWQYDIHEGIIAKPEWHPAYAVSWAVNHHRDAEDIKADKSRNIQIIENMVNKDARIKFYWGKELYEAQRPFDALPVFDQALKDNLEYHDRLLSYQYAAYSAMACYDMMKDDKIEEKKSYFNKVLDYCDQGIKLEPNRAEYHVCIGDMYLKMGDLVKSVPYFSAAKNCINHKPFGSVYEGAIYSFLNCYGEIPSLQLSKIYTHLGDLARGKKEALDCIQTYKNEEAKAVLAEIERIESLTRLENNQNAVDDIVFSCPPHNAYEFDEEMYKTKAMGGSETALIQMAKFIKSKTGRPVKVFNMRSTDIVSDSGVEYISTSKVNEYFSKNKPKAHIQWRHNIRLSNAPSYLWCHDLVTYGVESSQNFDKIMCLSQFHKDYVQAMQGVPDSKIVVTRNGVTPEKFDFERPIKNPNKFVYMSSPDRGLGRAMKIMDEVIKDRPFAELHVYYGIEGLHKYGRSALHDKLKKMMADRPYVKYHGFTEQNKMYKEVADAVVWLHPATFIESFCITALEMQALNIFPITRKLGALRDTLKDADNNGMAILFDQSEDTLDQDGIEMPDSVVKDYVKAVHQVCDERKWENIKFDLEKHSWQTVAQEWIDFMEIS